MHIPWLYVWSPKYHVFHTILYNTLTEKPSCIQAKPACFPQSAFRRIGELHAEKGHFFSGINVKQTAIIHTLMNLPVDYMVFSDVDVIVGDVERLGRFLEDQIRANPEVDMFFMEDCEAAFCLMKRTASVLQFYKDVVDRINGTDCPDGEAIVDLLKSFGGQVKYFGREDMFFKTTEIQQKHLLEFHMLQLMCENTPCSDTNMVSKIYSIVMFLDISDILSLIPVHILHRVANMLMKDVKSHYVIEYVNQQGAT